MARARRFQFHLGPFRAAYLALLLIACASAMAKGGTKAEHLYLLAGTPLRYETDSYPVTLYTVGPKGQLETARQIFSKKQGLWDVRDDLQGWLYVMNQWQNILSVIDENNPERVDTVKKDFGCMYGPEWGVVAPPGQGSSAIYPNTCGDAKPWEIVTVAGTPTISPRISRGKWTLYRWFRYRGAPVIPRAEMSPVGNIVKGKILLGPIWAMVGVVSGVPPALPPSVGAHKVTLVGKTSSHTYRIRTVAIVADTARFFAFSALPFYSEKWPVSVYVQNKATGRWSVIDSPFIRLWPRVFGSWLATTVEEPNPAGKESPGFKNERTLLPYAYEWSDLPQVRGVYGTKTYMPGELLLQNLVDGRKLAIDTGQQDSEVLDVRKDGLVLYRVNNEIFSAQIEGDKLSAPKLVVKGVDVPEVHWVFWSRAGTEPQVSAANVRTLFAQLKSRGTSSEAVKKLTKLGSVNSAAREYLAQHLPTLIRSSRGRFYWLNAVQLSGKLKLEDAAPALAVLLTENTLEGGAITFAQEARMGNDPVGRALVEIGEPSVEPVAQVLEQGNKQARWRAARILFHIGSPTAIQTLRSYIPKEKDPHLKQFIASHLRSYGTERSAH